MKYSNKDLQPYKPTPEQKDKYIQCLKQYSMPDEDFVDVKVYEMTEMTELVAMAIGKHVHIICGSFDREQAALAAIDAMRTYLREHDDGFQCQECNAMVVVDAAFGVNK